MLSNRTIKFLTAAILIAVAVFATTSMISPSHLVTDQSMAVSNAQGLAQYHESERAGYAKEAGLAQYRRSEWGLNEGALNTPQAAGLAIYLSSERSFPIRKMAAFNSYQRSEWFGQ